MNSAYVHTLINHFPIVLTVVGTAVLLLALVRGTRGAWLYALATLTLAGVSVYPAWETGADAADSLRGTWYVVRTVVFEHAGAANYALASILLLGFMSGYAWWRLLRRDVRGLPPGWLRVIVTILAALSTSVVARTAYLGGKIVHESPRLEKPPAGVDVDSSHSVAVSCEPQSPACYSATSLTRLGCFTAV